MSGWSMSCMLQLSVPVANPKVEIVNVAMPLHTWSDDDTSQLGADENLRVSLGLISQANSVCVDIGCEIDAFEEDVSYQVLCLATDTSSH